LIQVYIYRFLIVTIKVCDLSKDIPNARNLLLAFINRAIRAGYMPASFEEKAIEETAKHMEQYRQQLEEAAAKNHQQPKIEEVQQPQIDSAAAKN